MLCDSPNYKLSSEPTAILISKSSTGLNYNNNNKNTNYDDTSAAISPPNQESQIEHLAASYNSYCSQSLTNHSSLTESRLRSNRTHPNIQHHPTIHPHSRHHRPVNILASENMPENNNDNNTITDNISDLEVVRKETENNIEQVQKLIDKLNFEIFKNPVNCTRPPSEYLEVYNTYTAELHFWQKKKESLEPRQTILVNEEPIEIVSKKPPLPKNGSSLPKFKLDHPTSLSAPNSNNVNIKHAQSPTTAASPTITTIHNHHYKSSSSSNTITSDSSASFNGFSNLPLSSSITSLPLSIQGSNSSNSTHLNATTLTNSNNTTQNSRSFGDFTDAVSLNNHSSSPSSSLATTPTCSNLSFLRLYIGCSTAVIRVDNDFIRF